MRAGIKLLFVPRRAGCLPHRLAAKHPCGYGVKVSVLCCGASAFIRALLRARHLRLAVPLWAGAGFVIQNPLAQAAQNAFTQKLSLLKYAVAVIFVLLLPVYFWWQDGVGAPAFCKYICPAGTLEAGLPLLALNANLRDGIGLLFGWKFLLMLVILGACVFIYRPFCRFLCPLGAWYGLFNKLSAFGITVDKAKCTDCNACVRFCKMDCQKVNDRECINCGECKKSARKGL